MAARDLSIAGNRRLLFGALNALPSRSVQRPFVTLLPAFSSAERQQAEVVTPALIDRGCVELCCVGPEAEQLHDALDALIESRGALEVVTTWHEDPADACEYFLHAAAGGHANLLALISSRPDLQAMLETQARTYMISGT